MSRLTIRFSESEDLKLSRLAAESGITKSQYIRNLLNSTNFQPQNNNADSISLNENVSQIAESMNNVSIYLNDINSHLDKQNQLLNLLVDFSKKSNSKIELAMNK
jgi:predicted DNA binding CopG/RHH family protein